MSPSAAYKRDYRRRNLERVNQVQKDWRSKNKAKILAWARAGNLKRKYGMTSAEYERLHHQQRGVCAACGLAETSRWRGTLRKLAVDHDHETGEVRGLLCMNCNRALGNLRDDIERIRGLLRYMEGLDQRPRVNI